MISSRSIDPRSRDVGRDATHEYNVAVHLAFANRADDTVSRATKSRREFDCTTLALALMRTSLRSSKGHRGPLDRSGPLGTTVRPIKALSLYLATALYIFPTSAALSFVLLVHVALSLCLHAPRNCRATQITRRVYRSPC